MARERDEGQLEFELGGPAYRLMERIGLIRKGSPSLARRIVAFLLITWVPLLVLSSVEGGALGPTPRESLLLDFATYARFFLAIPLLFAAEVVVGPRLRSAGLHFVQGGFVRAEDLLSVEAAVDRVSRRREALLPELVILASALLGAWYISIEAWPGAAASATWSSAAAPDGIGTSMAGLWYRFVSLPILQFFMYRWLWRLLIWSFFLRDLSRLNLNLVASHPDRAGGLGFLGTAHTSLAIFPFAFGCVLSAHAAFQIRFEAAPIDSFRTMFVGFLVVMELICLGPLLIFVPLLSRARRDGLRRYSLLADTYNRAFDRKWAAGEAAPDEPLLGNSDIQSLADLGNSFGLIRDMRIFPFGQQQIVQIAVLAALPALPLIFLVIPVGELLKILAGALL